MPEKIYFYLLILCGILSQGIFGIVADTIEKSSDILEDSLHRQKRVVSYLPNEDVPARRTDASYIVNIKYRSRLHCVGSILSLHVVITNADCALFPLSEYKILSGSHRSDTGDGHDIIDVRKHFGGHPSRPTDGIALLIIAPRFTYARNTFPIELHSAPLLLGTLGFVGGWGFNAGAHNNKGTQIRQLLRMIEVPIMPHRACVNLYRPYFAISDKDVCTYHPQRHCGDTDGGAPLVVDGQLAGVHLMTRPIRNENNPQFPDVFVVLQHTEYNQWIRTNIHEIEELHQNN